MSSHAADFKKRKFRRQLGLLCSGSFYLQHFEPARVLTQLCWHTAQVSQMVGFVEQPVPLTVWVSMPAFLATGLTVTQKLSLCVNIVLL